MNEADSILAVLGLALCGADVEGDLGALVEEGDELVVERVDLETEGVEVERHAEECVVSERRKKGRKKGGEVRGQSALKSAL